MKNLPKEWQERAEQYEKEEGLEVLDARVDFYKGASEMQEAILKVIDNKIVEFRRKQDGGNSAVANYQIQYYIDEFEGLKREIQNVKPVEK